MALIKKAAEYILGIITEDETVKSFPKEFVAESAKWIRSWFLKDDPKTEAKLKDTERSPENKKGIIETKLDDMELNAALTTELTARLNAFEHLKTTKFNVIEGGMYKITGNTHIGTVGESTNRQADEENVIKNANFEVGGDFRLGNTTQIVNNIFGAAPKDPPQYAPLKTRIENLIAEGKTEKAIEMLLDAHVLDDDDRTSIFIQSGRINELNRQVNNNILSPDEAKRERAKINLAVLALAKGVK